MLKKPNILVVDDDVTILRLVRESLKALQDCEVDSTPSPEYAFEMILNRHYDLFIFDFMMPGLDGAVLYSLVSKLYSAGVVGPIGGSVAPPLLLLSGNAAQKRAQALLREPGVQGLLAKPFTIEKLMTKVQSCLWTRNAPALC